MNCGNEGPVHIKPYISVFSRALGFSAWTLFRAEEALFSGDLLSGTSSLSGEHKSVFL